MAGMYRPSIREVTPNGRYVLAIDWRGLPAQWPVCTPAIDWGGITRGEEGALPRECHSLTFFCNSGGYLPYIFLWTSQIIG
jgi:hypothetical protein